MLPVSGYHHVAACVLVAFGATAAHAQGAAPALDGGATASADTRQFDALARLARERLERALLIDIEREDARRPLLAEAERYARAAAELAPDRADGWFLTAAALGLRAEYESTRTQIRMGGEMWTLASTALERDPDHAGAHHVMGRLNLEAMSLSGVARLVATHLYGSTLMRRASWEQAERHLRRAVALEPDALHHRLWLARLYLERDEEADARRLLEAIVRADAGTELERIWQAQAADLLAELD